MGLVKTGESMQDPPPMAGPPPGRRLRSRERPTPHVGLLGDRDCVALPTGVRPPLGPVEGFILSKCDGRRTLGDVAAMAALSVLEVAVVVARLGELGAATLTRPGAAPEEPVLELEDDDWPTIEPGSERPPGD